MKKIGRNDPCPCGSGKKYKQCCLLREGVPGANAHSVNTLNPGILQEAIDHHQAGRLSEAEALYRQILQAEPEHPDALHLLGLIEHQMGRSDIAVELIVKAIDINPAVPPYHNNMGTALVAQGKLDEATESYGKALFLDPGFADAHNNMGTVLQKQGKLKAAVEHYREAISINPDHVDAHNNLGTALKEQGKLEAAVEHYRKALSLNPDFADAHSNLGSALKDQGKLVEAINSYREAISLKPEHAETYCNLGSALKDQGKPVEAINSYREALSLKPDFIEAHNNIGITLQEQGKLDEAIEHCRLVLLLKPDLAEAHYNLGNVLKEQGKFNESIEHYHKVLSLNPGFAEAHYNLGVALQDFGRLDEAVASYRRALEIKPDYAEARSNLIFTLDLAAAADMSGLFGERKKWDAAHAAPLWREPSHANDPAPARRLRIGYVSADFNNHSAPKVFGGMLTRYDRSQFDVFAYSNSRRKDDSVTGLFRQNVTGWRAITGVSDEAVDGMIREDRIDILVDLSGHSAGNRLLVFARKPAPVQVTAWGYATGTGLRAMDAFFTDPVMVPPQDRRYFSEEIRYLPSAVGSFFNEPFPDVNGLPALPDGAVTFGSFNRLTKISEEAYRAWAEILLGVPRSRMILKTADLDNAETRKMVVGQFAKAGVDGERIIMQGKTSWYEHMRAYNRVDFALDPFPHGGGVTALEGLMMGVPVVTLRWPTTAGRLSASIMTTLGLGDWIAETREEYVGLAVQKAGDLRSLASLRRQLRGIFASSVIGDQAAYARAVEREYRLLWQAWCLNSIPKVGTKL